MSTDSWRESYLRFQTCPKRLRDVGSSVLLIYFPVSSVLPLFSGRMVGHDFVGHISFREQNPMPMPYRVCLRTLAYLYNILYIL